MSLLAVPTVFGLALALAACGGAATNGPGGTPTPTCTVLAGSVVIRNSLDWKTLVDSGCTSITGDLQVTAPGLVTLQGISPITSIGGKLTVSGNTTLTGVELPALISVGGVVISGNTTLAGFNFPLLGAAGTISITSNPALRTLGFPTLTTLSGAMTVVGNVLLPQCLAWDLKSSLVGHGAVGPFTISGNDPSGVCASCSPPTATLSWTLQDANGSQWSCASAGVSSVDVYFNGTRVGPHSACSSGGAILALTGIAPGNYEAIVEGTDSVGTIWDRSNPFTVTVSDCGDRRYAPVLGEGWLNVDYHFGTAGSATDVCHGGFMWFALRDEVANNWISAVDASTPVGPPPGSIVYQNYYGCYDAFGGRPLKVPVPFGTYTLAWLQEVQTPLTTPNPVQQACVQPPFHLTAAGTSSMPVTMGPYSGACPAYP
jgi:hypothetical protein